MSAKSMTLEDCNYRVIPKVHKKKFHVPVSQAMKPLVELSLRLENYSSCDSSETIIFKRDTEVKKSKEPASKKARVSKIKEKKERDPNKPKKPMGAYFLFLPTATIKLKLTHPELSRTEILTEASALWRGLPTEEKKLYSDPAERTMAEYKVLLAEYEATIHVPSVPNTSLTEDNVELHPVKQGSAAFDDFEMEVSKLF